MDDNWNFYPSLDKPEKVYTSLVDKREFYDNKKSRNKTNEVVYLESYQLLLRNFINRNTPYDSMLLNMSTGSGKTCSAIAVAEGMKDAIVNANKKVVVLIKNKTIAENFREQLISNCTGNTYLTDTEREIYFNLNSNSEEKRELKNRVIKDINTFYEFITFGEFVNRVLGAKTFNNKQDRKVVKKDSDGKLIRNFNTERQIKDFNNTLVIIDEAHNITNNDKFLALKQVLYNSINYKLLLLTATPIFDNVKEIFELTNLLNSKNEALPVRKELAKSNLIENSSENPDIAKIFKSLIQTVSTSGIQALKKNLVGKVITVKSNTKDFPKRIEMGTKLTEHTKSIKVVHCHMEKSQFIGYQEAIKLDLSKDKNLEDAIDLPDDGNEADNVENYIEEQEIVGTNANINAKSSSLFKNSSDASTIIYPNGNFGKEAFAEFKPDFKNILNFDNIKQYSIKLYKILENISKTDGTVFIYSNYVSAGGTSLIEQCLKANGYNKFSKNGNKTNCYIVLDDKTSIENREYLRRQFNKPENKYGEIIKILIGSPVTSEGITLKNVRQVHLLEPSWNVSRINQIVGRAIRHKSHIDLPEEERTVEVYKYVAVYPKNTRVLYIDEQKYALSDEKERANNLVQKLLEKVSITCNLNKLKNCIYDIPNSKKDNSTYLLNNNFFGKFEIDFIIKKIKQAYTENFVYKLKDFHRMIKSIDRTLNTDNLFYALSSLIDNKSLVLDKYNRSGYIIQRGDYYIFNPENTNEESSLFEKTNDFREFQNKKSLEQYLNSTYKKTEKKKKIVINKINNLDTEILKKREDIEIETDVFGSLYSRTGFKDDAFRIVDNRRAIKTDFKDNRKKVSGMACNSYKLSDLVQIVNHLKIVNDPSKYDKNQLCSLVANYFQEKGWLLD